MSKRFVDCGFEALEDWCFTDTETDKSYYLDYNDEIIDLLNELDKENKKLKSINNQLEERLEESGIGIALKMEDFE